MSTPLVFGPAVEYALFKGTEQEGPFQGCTTLFVYKRTPRHLIEEALADDLRITNLYFGAGWLSEYSIDDALHFASIGRTVTVESVSPPVGDLSRLRGTSLFWMMPIVWEGLPTEALKLMAGVADNPQVFVKIDTGSSTHVLRATDFHNSVYADYQDELILTKVST